MSCWCTINHVVVKRQWRVRADESKWYCTEVMQKPLLQMSHLKSNLHHVVIQIVIWCNEDLHAANTGALVCQFVFCLLSSFWTQPAQALTRWLLSCVLRQSAMSLRGWALCLRTILVWGVHVAGYKFSSLMWDWSILLLTAVLLKSNFPRLLMYIQKCRHEKVD